MITYKGFEKGLICRGYQFKAHEVNVCEKAKTVREGFHSAENPLDVLTYYPNPETSEYWMCEVGGDVDEDGADSKVASTELTPMNETRIEGMESMSTRELKAEIEAVKREKDALTERIAQMEEEAIEAERDYNGKADELENAQKALREANTEKKNAEATAESAKKLAAAYEKEKNKAVKEKAAAEKKEADLLKQINEATAKIKELEESAENKAEPEQMTVEAAVSEEAIAEERARIKEELRAEIKAEYEKKLAAAANPDVQRCTVHFEAFCSDFQRMTKALAGLPEDSREKIKKNVREVLQRMMEEFKDE